MGRGRWALLVGLASCGSEPVFRDAPWSKEDWVVVVVSDEDRRPLAPEPKLLAPGQALALELSEDQAVRVEAWSFRAEEAGGPRLGRCGPTFGGQGRRLSDPSGSWSSTLGPPDASTGVSLDPVGAEGLLRLDLREACLLTACEGLGIDRIFAPFVDRKLEQLVVLDDHRVIVSSDVNDDLGGFDVWFVDGEQWQRLDGGMLSAPPADLARDPERGVVVGALRTGQTFEIDPESLQIRLTDLTTPGRVRSAFGGGRWVRYGSGGLEVRRGPNLPRLDDNVLSITLPGLNRVALSSSTATYFYDGGPAFRLERPADAREKWNIAAGDDEVLAFAGSGGKVLLRDPANDLWNGLGRPFGGNETQIRGLVPLGGARLLACGEIGMLGILDIKKGSDGACTVDPPPATADLLGLALSPSGRVAFAVTNELDSVEGDAPQLLRITVP